MTPVTTEKYDLSQVPAEYHEAFMLTAYIIRDSLRAVRTLRAVTDGHALLGTKQNGWMFATERDLSAAFDTFAQFLGNRVGPSAPATPLGKGAEQDVLSLMAIGEMQKLLDSRDADDEDRLEEAEREAAMKRLTDHITEIRTRRAGT